MWVSIHRSIGEPASPISLSSTNHVKLAGGTGVLRKSSTRPSYHHLKTLIVEKLNMNRFRFSESNPSSNLYTRLMKTSDCILFNRFKAAVFCLCCSMDLFRDVVLNPAHIPWQSRPKKINLFVRSPSTLVSPLPTQFPSDRRKSFVSDFVKHNSEMCYSWQLLIIQRVWKKEYIQNIITSAQCHTVILSATFRA